MLSAEEYYQNESETIGIRENHDARVKTGGVALFRYMPSTLKLVFYNIDSLRD